MRRKLSEIWIAIDDLRPNNIKKLDWKRSYDGIKTAIEYIGYKIITTKEEFSLQKIFVFLRLSFLICFFYIRKLKRKKNIILKG